MKYQDKIKHLDYNSVYTSRFLSLTEQAQLKNKVSSTIFKGGYHNPEYKRAYINDDASNITCLKIIYNSNFLTLSHQNILGSILSLNIERDCVGDILVDEQCFFVISELKDFILNELTSIGNHPITLQEIDGSNLRRTINFEEHTEFIDSLRLDLVVARITKKSRIDAKFMIDNDFIKVNHLISNKPSKSLQEQDIISIRKYGRYQLLDTSRRSKKGKIALQYGKYI